MTTFLYQIRCSYDYRSSVQGGVRRRHQQSKKIVSRDSEYHDQFSNTGDSVAAIQEESITEFQVAQIRCAHSNARSERSWPQHAESPSRRSQTESTSRRWKPNSRRSVTTQEPLPIDQHWKSKGSYCEMQGYRSPKTLFQRSER